LGEDSVENVLKNFGLTHLETEVYIFLAKHGVLKCSEVARQMKKDRAQALRILKNLQAKNLVEATLEVPTRYAAVSFEQIIDLSIKAKRDEAALMESTKRQLLDTWSKIGKTALAPSLEKFVVVEGDRKIYSKIIQMVEGTKNQLSAVSTIPDLVRIMQSSLFDAKFRDRLSSKLQFRFITEISDQNIRTAQSLFKRALKTKIEIRFRNPDLGLGLFPRMIIRDNEEILLFINPKGTNAEERASLSLWTNCKTIVQSFSTVFEDLWTNSTDVSEKIAEIETKKPPHTVFTPSIGSAPKTYDEILTSAKEEIIAMTSCEGLLDFRKRIDLLRELSNKGVSVKIMAPITRENWQPIQELLRYCSIRHTPTTHIESTIIDGKHLIQSKNQPPYEENRERIPYFGTFDTTDREYVEKIKSKLDDLWRNALIPSVSTLDSIMRPIPPNAPSFDGKQTHPESENQHRKLGLEVEVNREILLEKDVLNKIISGKKYPAKNWPKDIIRLYGSNGLAVIHPAAQFNLPDMAIWAMHLNKQSSFGAADCLLIFLWLENPKGGAYVPVAFVSDNLGQIEFHKVVAAGTPSGQFNAHLIRKDALQIRIHGNTFFAAWAIPIPLFPTSRILPPSCLLFEGYGPLTTGVAEFKYPSGVKVTNEFNGLDALVTYFHPASKYSGPGTDGRLNRDLITTMHPP
jgi:sugar-specific transcriptional regulator TrmB